MKAEGRKLLATAALILLLFAGSAWGDVIWTGTGVGRGLRQEVNVLGVEGGELIYLLNGNRSSTPLERIQQIELEGERGFNTAEQAFSAGDWNKAVQEYLTAAQRHPKLWVRRRAAERLIRAATSAGLFDEAVTGYVQLTLLDPTAAVGREPPLGESLSPEQLQHAAQQVQAALVGPLDRRQEKPLLAFLLNLQNRLGNQPEAVRVAERLGHVMGQTPGDDPALFAQVLLGRAELALSRDQLAEAAAYIQDNRALFNEPRQQSEALMILARVAERQAGDDPKQLMDAALAYMKVVAHFGRGPGTPQVPEALLKVAQIHETLRKPESATELYREITRRFPSTPAASEARRRLDSLESAQ